MIGMMWFKREPKPVSEKSVENGVVGRLRRKKPILLKPTRESSERETSTESDKERRRYSDILDMKVSLERRDESDESLYESADCHSDAISASDDALPRLGKTPTLSKESLKVAVTDEEVDITRNKKGHRKTMSLSNPLEIVKNLGDEWFESAKKDLEKNSDKKKSRESLWSEEDRDSIHGSNMKLDQIRKNSKKEDKSQSNSRKSSTTDAPKRKSSKGSSVSALNLFRRKKTPTSMKPVENPLSEDAVDKVNSIEEILNSTLLFLEGEKRHASISDSKPPQDTDSDDEPPTPKILGEHRRRLSRQTSRGKSKVRGKSQSVKVNTLRKSHSGTLKKAKKKSVKTPSIGRSRQASIVEQTPIAKKKNSDSVKHSSWFSSSRGESRREGSAEEQTAPDADVDTSDTTAKETPDKDNNWRAPPTGRGVNRAESCRERDAPRRGKHRNASDPNRLTAHNNHDLEPGAATAPSGSSSSSSLSSRSNESNTVAAEQQASQSDWSEEEEPLAAQWADSLPPHVLESLQLSPRLRKRQEVIHELIVSEGSHVRWLKVLVRVFLRPLEAAPTLLPSEELRALFPNLPDVRDWHAQLHTQLRTLRNNAPGHVVPLGPLAETMLGTLGEAAYATCLSRFCRGQRLALEALRERRRKNKELHQFLASREQLPLCGRLQLRDLLACVWQRLTKYRLLLESVLKTVSEGDDDEDDVAKLQRALEEAKYMLNSVDTAIRAAENEHRLRTIQNKLEVRVERSSGTEWDELKRLDLTQHRLRLEGDLSLRHDSSKKIAMLALMFEEMLVLLQREGDKYVLKPIPQPSQHAALSPLIKWDKVLFRPNAAVRNTFFLMNINGVQMHELSANTNADYNTWVNYIQEAPLAKVELKQSITPSHQASRSTDDSGINVSRNPSDASEKSNLTAEDTEPERDRLSLERVESERDRTSAERTVESDKDRATEEDVREKEREDKCEKEPEAVEREEKHVPRRPTVGRISTHAGAAPGLEPTHAITVRPPLADSIAHTAETAYTYQEQLRRLDEGIRAALAAKSAIVGRVLGVPPPQHKHLAELAVAEALGEVDIHRELRATRQSSRDSSDDDALLEPDVRQLLLAAHEQANQLTEAISKALTVNEAAVVAARARRGRCNNCRGSTVSQQSAGSPSQPAVASVASVVTPVASLVTPAVNRTSVADLPELPPRPILEDSSDPSIDRQVLESMSLLEQSLSSDASYDLLGDVDDAPAAVASGAGPVEGNAEEALESNASAAVLAARLSRLSCGVQRSVSRLLLALPADTAQRKALRAELSARTERADRLHAALNARRHADYQMTDEIYFMKPEAEQPIQDQPSNGG
ncbi:hypothetical protein ABMA27_010083 [Loxostege sticticalis]|uniref:DH domain-containing protein n=1 Tax=Loxostege sticticalis TaxID=481309 RepID=A0ABR3H4I6_LOXSC